MKKLLKNKGYLTLMGAQAISSIGDWLSIVAIITLVGLKWNASPIEVSFVILCLAVPMALLGPVAGIVADRLNRKVLMIVSDVVRAALILLLTVVSELWMVYAILLAVGVFSSVFIPAKNGKLKELVDQKDMKGAMSLTSVIDSSTKILGPLLSGLLVTLMGAQMVFIIDSGTFLLSALLLLFLPKTLKVVETEKTEKQESFKQEMILGARFIKSSRFMVAGLLLLAISLLMVQLSDSQLIVLLRELTTASPDLFGYLVTASGSGMFLAGVYLTKKTDYKAFPLMLIGVCGIGLSFGMLGVFTYFDLSYSIVWAALLGFLAGFSASLTFVPFQASVQVETPVHMTGRVFGVVNSVTTTATIIGPLLGGWMATILGVIPTFIITASLLVIISLIGLLAKNKVERGNGHVSTSERGTSEATSG
ncbi:MFS transporter [Halobacillus locisalis]|uniref:MFS transporter n=1 Tax=Halobacillus locisalis TaxID=220753 RepID=A0A838CV78_9BACI|nr:MFS transporter [Halobacillus locisalis]MBA2175844.1 MFS transporter [Halobacillus locisalis]